MPERWYPLSISQEQIAGGFTIVLATDTPCHLWLYWTDKVPWVHRASTIKRGLAIPWDAYWCYVSWTMIDQEEAGDTTTHTYIWTGWEVCQTKYFRFHGTIAGETSPSDSPIFRKHYTAYVPPPPEYYSFVPCDPTTGDMVDQYNHRGYAFEAALSGYPLSLIACFDKFRNTRNGILEFWNVGDDWKPYGAAIASIVVYDDDIPMYPNKKDVAFPVHSVSLIAGNRYAWTFHLPTQGYPYAWNIYKTGGCTEGNPGFRIYRTSPGWRWVVAVERDQRHWLE